jgi:hypothetical protein
MAVVQQVRLAIFSRDDLKEIERDVIQVERLAQRKVVAEKKIQSNLSRRGGIFAPGLQGDSLPKHLTRQQDKAEADREAHSKLFATEKSKDKKSKNAIFEETVNKVDRLEQGLDEAKKAISNVEQITDNPFVFITHLFTSNKQFARLFAGSVIVSLAVAVATTKLKEFFGPNGPGDIRKIIRDEVAVIPDMKLLVDVRSGKVFFTADSRVRSEIAQSSASENLGEKSQRFNLLNVGGNLLD